MTHDLKRIQEETEAWRKRNPHIASPRAKSTGPFARALEFVATAAEITKVGLNIAGKILQPVAWLTIRALPFVKPAAHGAYRLTMTSKDEKGIRHFAPRKAALSTIAAATVLTLSHPLMMGAYYWGTAREIDDVYIPDAAVFINQQFYDPNQPGRFVALRDEIFTVMGKRLHADGLVEPVRFDIDTNAYFPLTTMRPDLLASRLNSQSPYGIKAKLRVAGIYANLPRYVRMEFAKWWNLRSEIVSIIDVEELQNLPPFVKTEEASKWVKQIPNGPSTQQQLPAPTVPKSLPALQQPETPAPH